MPLVGGAVVEGVAAGDLSCHLCDSSQCYLCRKWPSESCFSVSVSLERLWSAKHLVYLVSSSCSREKAANVFSPTASYFSLILQKDCQHFWCNYLTRMLCVCVRSLSSEAAVQLVSLVVLLTYCGLAKNSLRNRDWFWTHDPPAKCSSIVFKGHLNFNWINPYLHSSNYLKDHLGDRGCTSVGIVFA